MKKSLILISTLISLLNLPAIAGELATAHLEKVSNQDLACRSLKAGESITVSDSQSEANPRAKRANERRYRITRSSANPKQLDLDLNFEFHASKGATQFLCKGEMREVCASHEHDQNLNKTIAEQWQRKVERCFSDYKPLMKDAESTVLNVIFTHDAKVLLAKVEINRPGEFDGVANSFNWPADEDCSIFIHEALHWTGLFDGYPTGPDSCRHVEPRDSIYNSVSWALGPRAEANVCVCKTEPCDKQPYRVEHENGLDCPKGFESELKKTIAAFGLERLSKKNFDGKEIRYSSMTGVMVKVVNLPEQPQHALYSMQLRAMEQPFCTRDNRYMDCTRNAYRSKTKDGCVKTADVCKGDWLK